MKEDRENQLEKNRENHLKKDNENQYKKDYAIEKLYSGITEIDDDIIEEVYEEKNLSAKEAQTDRLERKVQSEQLQRFGKSSRNHRVLIGLIAAAACLVVIAGGLIIYFNMDNTNSPFSSSTEEDSTIIASSTEDSSEVAVKPDDLPAISIVFDTEAMGFEGLLFYDIEESGEGNPWNNRETGEELETLPVYRNLAYTDMAGVSIYLTRAELLSRVTEAADALGLSILETHYESMEDSKEEALDTATDCYYLTAKVEGGEIRALGNGIVTVMMEQPMEVTDSIRDLIGLQQSESEIWGDYTFDGEQNMYHYEYNSAADLETAILNYNFDRTEYIMNENQEIIGIRYGNLLDTSEFIGDYPLRSEDQARQSLLEGDYYTTVPSEYLANGQITEDLIAKVELSYRTGNVNEYFVPYYRYYVRLDVFTEMISKDEGQEGLTCYGIYYVPAVTEDYLER